jgi:protein-disulfide isomerase
MKIQIGAAALALTLVLSGCGDDQGNVAANGGATAAPLTQIAAPNNGDWREIVTQTEQGGFLMGNPDAPVKLVEYASLTCPHCARFAAEAGAPLRDTYVKSGQVSWEYRSYVLGGAPDMVLSLLSRCQPPSAFFRTIEEVFEQQHDLVGRLDDEEVNRIQPLPPEQQLAPLARAMELDTFFARRGMPETRFAQCLADTRAVQQLTDQTNRAQTEEQVTGTPTFFINGEVQDVNQWGDIESRLRSAIEG